MQPRLKKYPSFMKDKDTTNQSQSPVGNDNSNDQSSGMTANTNIKISPTNSYVDTYRILSYRRRSREQ